MQYFKNAELAKLHHVSKATVGNWVEAAKQGKLDLTLHERAGKSYIANTTANIGTIEQIVGERRKFRNSNAAKTVKPRPEFYKLYNQGQLYDIVTNLDIHHEIPRQYNYFDGGANNWDMYTQRLALEDSPNLLKSTIQLLEDNQGYIDALLAGYKRVNVVDVGVGNAMPVKDLLNHLLEKGILGRYIALDISSEMLGIAKRNVNEWFNGKVAYEGYEADISYDRFGNILAEEYLQKDVDSTANLVLLLGGTLGNLRRPEVALSTIHESMARNDLLLYSNKLDSATSRRYFDFSAQPGQSGLSPNHRFIFDLLNIDDSFYEVEMGFDEVSRQRFIRVRLRVALTIKFEFEAGQRTLKFDKGETILLWRSWQMTANEVERQFEKNEFYTLHSSQTRDKEYILTIAQVKCE